MMENYIIFDLKQKSFALRSLAEKREIIKLGRATPHLKTKIDTRSFQIRWYEQIDWFCASPSEEKKILLAMFAFSAEIKPTVDR